MVSESAATLEVRDVTKRYRRGPLANDGISLSIEAGTVFGLLGPNGAGKTTLIGQILGLLRPSSGTITIDGTDVVADPAFARRSCSYQPQTSVPIDNLKPTQAIELAGRIRGAGKDAVRARAEELLQALDLGEWSDRKTPLSGGVARLVAFAMAAVVPGRIVILDEPTNDVDPLRRKLLWQQVRGLADDGAAVLLVTHNVLEADRCVDQLAVVDHGRVLATGTPAALKAALGSGLTLEVVVDAGTEPPAPPAFARTMTAAGRRTLLQVDVADAGPAVAWAAGQKDAGRIIEFALSPASLEDVYVRHVRRDGETEEEVARDPLVA